MRLGLFALELAERFSLLWPKEALLVREQLLKLVVYVLEWRGSLLEVAPSARRLWVLDLGLFVSEAANQGVEETLSIQLPLQRSQPPPRRARPTAGPRRDPLGLQSAIKLVGRLQRFVEVLGFDGALQSAARSKSAVRSLASGSAWSPSLATPVSGTRSSWAFAR